LNLTNNERIYHIATKISKHNVATWPKSLRQAVDAIAVVFAAVYELARTRAATHPSSTVRAMAQSDDAIFDAKLLEREADILRRNREEIPARRRPHYSPADRLEIIQLMRLRGWSIDETAGHFAVHKNTISAWVKELETDPKSTLFTGVTPFNKIGDAARILVRAIRELCPEREFGTRSIAMRIIRAGIQLGRSSVQRILREKKPTAPGSANLPDRQTKGEKSRPKPSRRTLFCVRRRSIERGTST
jgi:transposase-like protein